MDLKKTRKIFGLVMLAAVVTLLILTFIMPGNVILWEILVGALIISFLGSYLFKKREKNNPIK